MSRGRPGITKGDRRTADEGLTDLIAPGAFRRAYMAESGMVGEPAPLIMSSERDLPHWKCPDCMETCSCIDPAARAMPHLPCGGKKKRSHKKERSDG